MYHIHYSKKAQNQIKKIDRQIQRLLFAWIDKHLEGTNNPRQHGKGLTGDKSREWRYRIGYYRLICDIQENTLIILALEFGHRKDIYH
ncbi:type II toxin-antitoxin system RelE/ParE family toxin [Granulicatella sp. zg-ZJ]|uniref:type II toxin-antitoxin system RelE family toxin n=1 Tax=Granulicatella sp. zg-ZJ TaxID=2678504 RepID=UPI0013D7805E|nr:type II toxin-antitoxin system RelE/ParE family toxin [Granulicatella sp. zg-ZJ]NEW62697.1 type II toxin-antitoxin system RelE/ParE family toxin [Granulicatella sp. zg-ZJ]